MLRKPDYQQDMVYIVQFPVSPKIRTISPFALKLETWLRLKKIKYEPIYSLKFSQKGQIPYIELNGEQIPDSNQIIKTLEEKGLKSTNKYSKKYSFKKGWIFLQVWHNRILWVQRTMPFHTWLTGPWKIIHVSPAFIGATVTTCQSFLKSSVSPILTKLVACLFSKTFNHMLWFWRQKCMA